MMIAPKAKLGPNRKLASINQEACVARTLLSAAFAFDFDSNFAFDFSIVITSGPPARWPGSPFLWANPGQPQALILGLQINNHEITKRPNAWKRFHFGNRVLTKMLLFPCFSPRPFPIINS